MNRPLLKWQIFQRWGNRCAGCNGDPKCKHNHGVGTDLHEEWITKGMASALPDPEIINSWFNCVPLCRIVNMETGAWHSKIRLNHARFLGLRDGATEEQAVSVGLTLIEAWIQTLELKTKVNMTISE